MADPTAVIVYIGGRDVTQWGRVTSVRIDDILNDAPNTAALTLVLTPKLAPTFTAPFDPPAFDAIGFNVHDGPLAMFTPSVAVGAPIAIYENSGADQIFGGEVITRAQYAVFDQPPNVRVDLTCTDFTRQLNNRKVQKNYAAASATAIVLDIVANFTLGIGSTAVEAGLPNIDGGITFTFEDVSRALSRIAAIIGAYWYVDYKAVLHFFTGSEAGTEPDPIVPGGRFADLKFTADLSQVRTRCLVEGDGATAALTLAAGDVITPVSKTSPFSPAGGLAVMGPWRIAYTGITAGTAKANTTGPATGGSEGGPPPSPPAAPTLTVAGATTAGALSGGPYYYGVTTEGSDGSRSPLGTPGGPVTITAAASPPPTSAALGAPPSKGPIAVGVTSSYATTFTTAAGLETAATLGGTALTGRPVATATYVTNANIITGNLAPGYYWYIATFLTPAGESLGTQIPSAFLVNASPCGFVINLPIAADGRVLGRRLYRSSVSASPAAPALPWRQVVDIPNNTTPQFSDTTADANLPTKNPPQFSTATDVGEAATVTVPTSADARVTKRRLYRQDGPGQYRLIAELPDNTTTTFADVVAVAGGNIAPTVNAIATGAINVSGVAIGPAGTARRRIFRTAAGGAQYRELVSLEDNATTSYADTTADAMLGGSPQPAQGSPASAGTIPPTAAGATQIQIDDLTGFPSAGWALADPILFRYTGTATAGGNFLTGIPASGVGSLTADIPPGTVITVAPALVGVSPVVPVSLGDAVQLIAQVDDTAAQAALAAIEGGDGVIENYIQDRRLSQAGAQARGLADLDLFKSPEIQLSYTTHDVNAKSGRTVHVALPAPTNLTGDFLIQRVTIDDVATWGGTMPRRKVQASTTRFSFDDVLSRILMEQH